MPDSIISRQSSLQQPVMDLPATTVSIQTVPMVTLEARELATKSVVVYQDRAEVKRLVAVQIPEQMQLPARMLIRVNNVSPMIARDSIRVEGQRGVILEVDYVEVPQFCGEEGDKLSDYERKTSELESQCATLNDQMEVLQRRLEVLDGVAKQIGKNALVSTEPEQFRRCLLPPLGVSQMQMQQIQQQQQPNGHFLGSHGQPMGNSASSAQFAPASLFLLSEDSMKNLSSFLDYYAKSAGETRKELREKSKQLTELKERLARAEWELNKQRGRMEYDKNKRAINLLVEILPRQEPPIVPEEEPTATATTTVTTMEQQQQMVELHLVYQVFSCTWRPAYSLRASSSGVLNLQTTAAANRKASSSSRLSAGGSIQLALDEDCSEAVLLSYHGMVEQNTDEDWKDAELILSTAQPCSASAVPCLPTLNAMLQKTVISGFRQRNLSSATARHHRRQLNSHAASQEDLDAGIGSFDYNELIDAQHLQQQIRAAAIGTSVHGSTSENGSIQSMEQVPSTYFPIDHPCTIPADGQAHKVDIAHIELVPTFWHECVPSRLTSAFVNAKLVNCSRLPLLPGPLSVFFNNSFVSTSNLRLVLPGEEFRCLLGVDPAVKVEYKRANLSNEQFGFMTKKSLSTHEQVISLRNAKASQSVQITVREPVPKALDESVKIALLQPELKPQRAECRLNKEHNLEWTVKLGPGEQRELVVKWTAEYPAQECVLFTSSGSACPSLHVTPNYGRVGY